MELDEAGLAGLGLPKGPTVRLRNKLEHLGDSPAVAAPPPAPNGFGVHETIDNECPICCDRPVDRRADCPGSHEFCSVCIQNWKSQTVMKSQKGTSCPMCREPVTVIIDLATGRPAVPRGAAAFLDARRRALRASTRVGGALRKQGLWSSTRVGGAS